MLDLIGVAVDVAGRDVGMRDEVHLPQPVVACHAGRFEGSVVLAERPELFRRGLAEELEPNPSSLSTAIRSGATSFEEAGGPRAYFGWPADATAEEGRRTVRTLGILRAYASREEAAGAD